jgi:ABC-type transport system involved in multi-copper enzyme maturation permease subunit
MTPGVSIGWVARQELADSIRSRRVWVFLLLYLAGSVAATILFLNILQKMETQLVSTLGLNPSTETGGVTATLWKSDAFRRMMTQLIGDRKLAESLLAIPPLALFWGWLGLTFGPLLVTLTASVRIAEEVWTGSVRFVLFRTTRLAWVMGKFLGQALQLLLAFLLSALGAWVVGAVQMNSFEPLPTALALLGFALKAWVYGVAYLGLATAVSQMFASPNVASALSFGVLIAIGMLHGAATFVKSAAWRPILEVLDLLTPAGHRLDLWRPDPAHLVPALVYLLVLACAYLFVGQLVFRRRDL